MKMKKFLRGLSIALLLIAVVTSCNKNDDIVAKPTITGLEVGLENSGTTYAGADLHIEAEIVAMGIIDNISVKIHPEGTAGFEYEEIFVEGYSGAKNATFHEHIDIPQTVAAGEYHLHIKVVDKNGNSKEAESELTIVKKNPSAALIFTPVTGTGVEGHGDHFHGLAAGVEGVPDTVTFDDKGVVISNGHLHLEHDAIYKVSLQTYDASGNQTQNSRFIANAATAANYKAFIIGRSFVLNPNTTGETGAIFQTRETVYADGATVSGATNTTGVTSYLKIGTDNKGEKDVIFVMRKLNTGVKATITRVDWNRTDYASAFSGSNELELKFEIHAE